MKRALMLAMAATLGGCERDSSSTLIEGVEPSSTAGTSAPAPMVLPKEITFNEHIQPILSENCYHCHGPDAKTRAPKDAPLRLDHEADAFAPRENGKPVIVKGNPDDSLLIKLIKSTDPDEKMPPPEGHKVLKQQEIALLEEWVRRGAVYEEHWAFSPVKRPTPPEAGEGFARNPIDRFIAAKLEENQLKPNPPADPRRFYRRLSFDLTGLPPNPADTEAFIAAHQVNPQKAVEDAADKLLATSASAEHLARHWLDAARYADTHGIHFDNYRSIWPYRDWVINAFKTNMPWDQFTIEQIAGDLFPNPTLDQRIATGFNRCLPTTGEGGAIPEEYLTIYASDRTETTSAIWLALTTGCASCHDHKFDPISTKEFYSLTAFFNNSTMSALDGNAANHAPNLQVPLEGDRERWAVIDKEIAQAEEALKKRETLAHADFEAWLTTAKVEPPRPDSTLALRFPLTELEGAVRGAIDNQVREFPTDSPRISGPLGSALVVSAKPIDLGDIGSFGRGDQVTYGAFIRLEGAPTGAVVARMDPANAHRGWDLYLENGKPASHIIDVWPAKANKLVAPNPLTPGKWHHVMVTFDGKQGAPQTMALYVDGVLQNSQVAASSLGDQIETPVPLRFGGRNGEGRVFGSEVALQDFRFYRRVLTPAEIGEIASKTFLQHILTTPVDQRTPEQNAALFTHYMGLVDEEGKELRNNVDTLKAEKTAMASRAAITLVMDEKPELPHAYVLARGVYTNKMDKVEANTPAVLPPMPPDAPKNRMGLARWLVDPANPLPARVTMNRTWYYLFGTGIVETTEDFGIMGARPSHPQLLDWLASEFVASKWDYRHMVKLMVTSATYQQSEEITTEKLEKDPANRLLSRGPRVRLDAEQLRDLALASSSLLVEKVGGPSVKPYQPDGIWAAVAMPDSNTRYYTADKGEGLYRRSLYTFWKRTAAPPSMELFNAPSREVFCVRRERTNTPLQALVLLNDPQFVEASRMLATHAMEQSPEFDARLDYISSRLLNRVFTAEERAVVRGTFEDLLATYKQQPEEAKQLITTGETPPSEKLDASELATWTVVSSQILNLDETVTR
jgi:hypothetical protein